MSHADRNKARHSYVKAFGVSYVKAAHVLDYFAHHKAFSLAECKAQDFYRGAVPWPRWLSPKPRWLSPVGLKYAKGARGGRPSRTVGAQEGASRRYVFEQPKFPKSTLSDADIRHIRAEMEHRSKPTSHFTMNGVSVAVFPGVCGW